MTTCGGGCWMRLGAIAVKCFAAGTRYVTAATYVGFVAIGAASVIAVPVVGVAQCPIGIKCYRRRRCTEGV